ncbi:hypothetical protein ACHAPQ_001699 [Fusarium lateritium]
MALNSNQLDPRQHPLLAIGNAIGAKTQGERRSPRAQARGKRENDGPTLPTTKAILSRIRRCLKLFLKTVDSCSSSAHSKTVGALPLISDTFMLQKQHFNRSKNLERMVHPCGSGAFGYFECTKEVTELTKANFLSTVGVKTPAFVRFSTMTLGRESPDEARHPRGFAIKLYTMEENYNIVGLSFLIFFCRGPIQGPDVIRSQYRNPANFLLDHDAHFDLLANTPEAKHAGLMFFSDHGTPQGWRFNHGYGCHTMDLWEEIEWTAHVQVMDPRQADRDKLGYDPFDITKVCPRSQFLMKEFGRLVLNKNPENFHRDVEQAAFSPGSMVPGIEDSPDPLLQFRMFFYRDAQSHRIGVNLHQIPVNCPFMAKANTLLNYISEDYAQGIYDLLDQPQFELSKVKELAETAQEWFKEPKFRPGPDSKLTGYPPTGPVYQA